MFLNFLEYCVTEDGGAYILSNIISSVVDLCNPKGVINSF